jgi:hypothetical protein
MIRKTRSRNKSIGLELYVESILQKISLGEPLVSLVIDCQRSTFISVIEVPSSFHL